MEGGVWVEAQVAYLDSTLEVGDVHKVFDVLPKIDGGFRHPWSSRSDKIKTWIKLNRRFRQRILHDGCCQAGGIIWREYSSQHWRSWSFSLYGFFQSRRTSSFRLCNFHFVMIICIMSLFSLLQSIGKPCLCFFAIVWVVCICICVGKNPSTEAALRPPLHCKRWSTRKDQVQKVHEHLFY